MTDRMIRACLAGVAVFGVLLALFGAVGALAQTINDRLEPLLSIHGKVCKPVANAAVLAWNANRKGVLRRKWIRGIARSIGRQAELAALGDFDLGEAEAAALSEKLAMRGFMGDMVDRIYRPERHEWRMSSAWDGFLRPFTPAMCDWLVDECFAVVSGAFLDFVYSEEAYRTRFALDRWRGEVGDAVAVWEAGGTLTDDQLWRLVHFSENYVAPGQKCFDRLDNWPNDPSGPSAQMSPMGRISAKLTTGEAQ